MAQTKATAKKELTTSAKAVTPVVEKKETAKKETEKKEPVSKTAKAATKEPVKKETVKKEPAKKASAAKTTVERKAEIKSTVYIELNEQKIVAQEVLSDIKKVWTSQFKGKIKDIKTLDVYIKPLENKAYFVVNGEGSADYFVEL